MKFLNFSVLLIAVLLAVLTWALAEFALLPFVSEEHLAATQFSVYALMFAEILSGCLLCATTVLATRENAPFAMAFPRMTGFYILVALICVPLAIFVFESNIATILLHACALFVVVVAALALMNAAHLGQQREEAYNAGRRKIVGLRERFTDVVEALRAKNLPDATKLAERLSDDLAYAQESVPASDEIDAKIEAEISSLLRALAVGGNASAEQQLVGTLTSLRALVERRERAIKQSR